MKQKTVPQEIIVVDNYIKNSKIQNLMVDLQRHNRNIFLKYTTCNKRGTSFVRNKGIESAKNEIIAFIDDDCTADYQWINRMVEHFKNNPQHHALVGKSVRGYQNNIFSLLDEIAIRTAYVESSYKERKSTFVQFIDTKNFAISKNVLISNKIHFDEQFAKYNMFDDYDLAFQLAEAGTQIKYDEEMIVTHYGRETALKHFERNIRIGLSLSIYYSKLLTYQKNTTLAFLYDKNPKLMRAIEVRNKEIQSREQKKLLLNKNKWFLLQLQFWKQIGRIAILSGYWMSRIMHPHIKWEYHKQEYQL